MTTHAISTNTVSFLIANRLIVKHHRLSGTQIYHSTFKILTENHILSLF